MRDQGRNVEPGGVIDGIDMFLSTLQDILDGEVFGISIPFVGDDLGPGRRADPFLG